MMIARMVMGHEYGEKIENKKTGIYNNTGDGVEQGTGGWGLGACSHLLPAPSLQSSPYCADPLTWEKWRLIMSVPLFAQHYT